MHVFLADLDKVDRAEPRRGLRRARERAPAMRSAAKALPTARPRSRARSTCATTASNGRCGVAARRRGFDAAAARASIRGRASAPVRPHPARRHASTSPRCASIGRGLLDWTPPAARFAAGRRRQSRARRARSGSIPAHGWRDVPVYDGAELAAGLQARRPAADRGAHHHRLRRPARPARSRSRATTSWSIVGAARMSTDARSRHPGAGAEPARPHLAPDGLGDDAHGALADLQPEPRLLLLHRRCARHA